MMHKATRSFALVLTAGLLACGEPAAFEEPDLDFRCYPGGGFGFVGLDSVEVSGNSLVAGSHAGVFSNNSVSLAGSYDIHGDVVSGGVVNRGGRGPRGSILEYAGKMTVEDPTDAVLAAQLDNDNHKIPCGSSCLSGYDLSLGSKDSITFKSGAYYFESITMNGKAEINIDGDVVFYLNGPAKLNGGASINPGSDRFVIYSASSDDIAINGNSESTVLIHAPHADVRLNGTARIKGGVLAKKLRISGTADLIGTADVTGELGLECGFEEEGEGDRPGLPSLPN